jgi:glycosyltransferase involved in cell wall biosynthesis
MSDRSIESKSQVPTVSVIIPAYRAESTLERAIRSARDSGASEVIVVDDGSDDGTQVVAESAGAVCVVQQNAGAAAARAKGAKSAKSDFLIFLDADDELVPAGVKRSIEVLVSRPELAVAAGTVIGVGTDRVERPFPIRFQPVTTQSLVQVGHGPWPPAAAVIRRSSYESALVVSPEPLAPRFAEDYELLIRLSIVGEISVRADPTCKYSLAGGKSVASASSAIEAKEAIRAHYAGYFGIPIDLMTSRRSRMAVHARVARAKWSAGDRFGASRELAHWFMIDPVYASRKFVSRPWRRN